MDKISSRRQRVVLFPVPFQGHINPMLQLANILYSNGFSITILHTNFNSAYKSNYPHFTFRPIFDDNPKDSNLAKLSSKGAGDLLSAIVLVNEYGGDSFRQELNQMLIDSKQQQEPIVCLITDANWYFTQSVADSLKLPRIVLRTSSLFCFLVFASIPVLDDQGYLTQVNSLFEEEDIDSDLKNIILAGDDNFKKAGNNKSRKSVHDMEERVSEIPVLKVKDVSKMKIKGKTDPSAKMLANMVNQTKASSGIIWNTFKELEEPELEKIQNDYPIPSFTIGPFHKHFPASFSSLHEPDRSFTPWLDQQSPKSILYISFGSAAQLEKQDFLEVAHGLIISKQRFLWVIRPGFVKGSEWIEVLPDGFLELVGERGRIVKWAPQQEVLAHRAIGAFWTHSGWNSTLESVCEGVPMICSPFWGDQPLNARYVNDVMKVGVYLEKGWERDEIVDAIRRVMVEEEMEEIRERARCLKEKVNVSLMKGGSSYEALGSLVGYISSL